MQPRFITFEGGEGAGKSTQIKQLAAAMQAQNLPHIVTREPGGSVGGETIRDLVVKGDADTWDPVSESLLFMTARYHHLEHVIKPALREGKWVLCDRFYDSTYVYQGVVKQVGGAWLDQLYTHLYGTFGPDITLLLDLPAKDGLARTDDRAGDETRFESLGEAFHTRIRNAFLARADAAPERISVIDALAAPADVHAAICGAINLRYGLQLKPQQGDA